MSTPCTTTFYEGGTPIATVYRHWDGYPEGHAVEILGFLAACEKAGDTRFTDPSYLAARFVAYLAERFRDSDNVVNFLSVGIVPSREWGCPNYTYEFHCDELDNSGRPRVRCYNGNAVEEPIPGIRFEAPKPELSIRDQIADAAEQGKPIGIHYRKLDSDRIGFTVEIREIVPTRFKEGASGAELVVAFDLDKQEPRTFRLDRIEGVEYDG